MGCNSSKSEENRNMASRQQQSVKSRSKTLWVFKQTKGVRDVYKLGRMLGQPGSYGSAFHAVHKQTGKEVAIKFINKDKFARSRNVQPLRNEIAVMKRLSHKNIAQFYEVLEDEEYVYIVQQLCSGGELFDRIKSKKRYSERDAAVILRQIFLALDYMHSNDVAHLDLKPDNFVFLVNTEESPVMVIDFGLSKVQRKDSYFKLKHGTSLYMAPEILKQRYTKSADMWAMGVVMFVMVFGYPPFHGRTDAETFRAISKGFNPQLRQGTGPWFPTMYESSDAARDLISKLLCYDPTDRITAKEALEHRFFHGGASGKPMASAVLSNLDTFVNSCLFKGALLYYFSTKMTRKDLVALKRAFRAVDKNGDGSITFAEIKDLLKEKQNTEQKSNDGVSEEVLRSLLKYADVDGDNKLSYTELVMAAVQKRMMEKEDRLRREFQEMDLDHDQKLTVDELKAVLGDIHKDYDVNEMMAEVDKDGDQRISLDEFIDVWRRQETDKLGIQSSSQGGHMPERKKM